MTEKQPSARPRKYQSALRARQAEQTRREIVTAAMTQFARVGWARTTVASVASEAGVALDTVYTAFKSKKALLGAAMDVAIVGDTEPLALTEREAFTALREEPPARRLRGVVEIAASIYSGPVHRLWAAMLEAAASDAEVAAWCTELEQRRHITIADTLRLVYEREPDARTLDIVWCLTSMETYSKLCFERGWTTEQWQGWLVEAIASAAGALPA